MVYGHILHICCIKFKPSTFKNKCFKVLELNSGTTIKWKICATCSILVEIQGPYQYQLMSADSFSSFVILNQFCHFQQRLRLGAQSVMRNTLRDPTQSRRRQRATRQQHPFYVAHQKEGIDRTKKKFP